MHSPQPETDRVYAAADATDAFVRRLLAAHGLPEGDAAIVASCLVSADLRGVDTHGIARLPGYLDRVRRGLINPRPVLEPRRVPPWGGREGLLGTNPFAAGAPGGALAPFLLDMSPAVAARGKIRRAERRGESIPLGYALDAQGHPTADPKAALGGVVLPIGGYKGSGLSMMMDIFGGVLSGAGYAGEVADQYKVFDRPQNVGHFF